MHIPRANPHHPNLGIWNSCKQPITRRQLVRVDFEFARFNIDGRELSIVFALEHRAYRTLVNAVADARKLLFIQTAFDCHACLAFRHFPHSRFTLSFIDIFRNLNPGTLILADTPKELGYAMPAEWAPHEGTWLSWPHNPRTWVGNFGPIPHVFAEIVRALCPSENLHICVSNALAEGGVRALLKNHGVDSASIFYHEIPTNDAWARDHGPIFITRTVGAAALLPPLDAATNQGRQECRPSIAAVAWRFNSWGGKYPPWDDDDRVPERAAAILNVPCFHPRMVLEGGSIDVNGAGALLTTECVLLNPNRNPQLSRKQIEARLDEYLGASHVIWLGDGIVGDDTDGHIDDLARFVNATTVVTVYEDDEHDNNYKALRENYERLQSATDQNGAKLTVVKLPTPGKVFRGAQHDTRPPEERLPASYANFYIGNGAVLVPIFGHENDEKAKALIGDFFPGRAVVGIRCNDLVGGYGAIHCVTQQQPAV